MPLREGVKEVADSEDEPMTSSPVAISGVADRLHSASQDALQASQDASQDVVQDSSQDVSFDAQTFRRDILDAASKSNESSLIGSEDVVKDCNVFFSNDPTNAQHNNKHKGRKPETNVALATDRQLDNTETIDAASHKVDTSVSQEPTISQSDIPSSHQKQTRKHMPTFSISEVQLEDESTQKVQELVIKPDHDKSTASEVPFFTELGADYGQNRDLPEQLQAKEGRSDVDPVHDVKAPASPHIENSTGTVAAVRGESQTLSLPGCEQDLESSAFVPQATHNGPGPEIAVIKVEKDSAQEHGHDDIECCPDVATTTKDDSFKPTVANSQTSDPNTADTLKPKTAELDNASEEQPSLQVEQEYATPRAAQSEQRISLEISQEAEAQAELSLSTETAPPSTPLEDSELSAITLEHKSQMVVEPDKKEKGHMDLDDCKANKEQDVPYDSALKGTPMQQTDVVDSNALVPEDSTTVNNSFSTTQSSIVNDSPSVPTEMKPVPKPLNSAKESQETTVAELRAQRTALIASLANLPNILAIIAENDSSSVSSSGSDAGPSDTEVMAAANKIVKKHIELLHEYNEIKDVGQGLMGLIADQRGVRIVEVQDEFGIGTKD